MMTKRSRNCLRDVMTAEEERAFYEENLRLIYENIRYYLDNLEYLDVYRVSFHNYGASRYPKSKQKEKLYK